MTFLPSSKNVDSRILESILDYNYLTNSYKLFWFAGIYQEVIKGNHKIRFRDIVCRMIAKAWYPLLEYHLNFGHSDKLRYTVNLINRKYNISSDIKEDDLLQLLDNVDDPEIEVAMKSFYNYVPYRLLSPFYSGQIKGIKEHTKNKIILELSQNVGTALYKINTIDQTIEIDPVWFDYIYENQAIVLGWLNYKIIYYLQKKNPNVPAIPFKLSAPFQRNLSRAKRFWANLTKDQNIFDIYTERPFSQDNIDKYGDINIDHFIPWSFVLHDEIWNLVPTFKNINSSKSNRLPQPDLYLDKFCKIQYIAFNYAITRKDSRTILEDYLNINKKLDINDMIKSSRIITQGEFTDSLKSTIMPLYQIAYNQGYELWQSNTGLI